jgi:hypothetical protein
VEKYNELLLAIQTKDDKYTFAILSYFFVVTEQIHSSYLLPSIVNSEDLR